METPTKSPLATALYSSSSWNFIPTYQLHFFTILSPTIISVGAIKFSTKLYFALSISVQSSWSIFKYFSEIFCIKSCAVLIISSSEIISPLRSTISGVSTQKEMVLWVLLVLRSCIFGKIKTPRL